MSGRRRKMPKRAETHVLARSRHRCALCFGLDRDSTVKQGQVAHIDRDPTNDAYVNLVFLCLPHHDQYDSQTSQSKNFSQGELRRYRAELDRYVNGLQGMPWPDYGVSDQETVQGAEMSVPPSSPEVFDRRILVYRALRSFLMQMVRTATVSLQELGAFAEATDEALFLFGPSVTDYLRQVYSKGVRLYYTSNRIRDERLSPKADYPEVVRENAEVLNWLSQQLEEGRRVFARELRLG